MSYLRGEIGDVFRRISDGAEFGVARIMGENGEYKTVGEGKVVRLMSVEWHSVKYSTHDGPVSEREPSGWSTIFDQSSRSKRPKGK